MNQEELKQRKKKLSVKKMKKIKEEIIIQIKEKNHLKKNKGEMIKIQI